MKFNYKDGGYVPKKLLNRREVYERLLKRRLVDTGIREAIIFAVQNTNFYFYNQANPKYDLRLASGGIVHYTPTSEPKYSDIFLKHGVPFKELDTSLQKLLGTYKVDEETPTQDWEELYEVKVAELEEQKLYIELLEDRVKELTTVGLKKKTGFFHAISNDCNVSGVYLAVYNPLTLSWDVLGTTDDKGILYYDEDKYRGSYLVRVRAFGYKPFEETIKFNSPTIVGLNLDTVL